MPCLPSSYDDDGQAAMALPLSAADYQPPFLWMDFAARLRSRSIHPTRGIGCLSPPVGQGSSPCFGSSLLRPRAPFALFPNRAAGLPSPPGAGQSCRRNECRRAAFDKTDRPLAHCAPCERLHSVPTLSTASSSCSHTCSKPAAAAVGTERRGPCGES